ncbi:hypothetical protein PESP_a3086 [Pseudoalteromonas espejiana DSM 9414]|uniref:Uncharacterized protein n=1 Tax=Pseudoalteromonas espejiana TaxID=28107 RepID=A0A510XST1_9GAMM|nr:hypothetical protein [Pseudoalteromonas espejiana]ASM50953.1 hypothetical protein PESP_a3086 [Pseudoalteromonas espejiana DSM 9414]GEK54086.1 hypothetical protein PES01_09310 [Pseudoalteromonas espejiana]
MKPSLEREEIEFIFDLYRPEEHTQKAPVEPTSTNYKNLRKPEPIKSEGVTEYLS